MMPFISPSFAADLDPALWPLASIGRVNVITGMGRRTQCTGTLVGRRHVLTAAHCLFNPTRGMWVHPTSVHFVAGYGRDGYRGHAIAASFKTGLGPEADQPHPHAAAARDWAVIELAGEIDLRPVKVRTNPEIGPGASIVRAGYRGDRAHVLTVQQDCAVASSSVSSPLLIHRCGSVPGESGSALLDLSGKEPEIVGVLVARSEEGGAGSSLAVPSRTFGAAVENALAHHSGPDR